jgi:hypothetical protein
MRLRVFRLAILDVMCIASGFVIRIFRYLQIAMVEENSGNPTEIFLNDRFVQVSILGWIIAFVFIIYF